jgi:ribosomal protein S27AE
MENKPKPMDPTVCQICGGKTSMIDSGDTLYEFWACPKCGVNNWEIMDRPYTGGVPKSLEYRGIIF